MVRNLGIQDAVRTGCLPLSTGGERDPPNRGSGSPERLRVTAKLPLPYSPRTRRPVPLRTHKGNTMKKTNAKDFLMASAVALLFTAGAVHADEMMGKADKEGGAVKCAGTNACKGKGACKSTKNACAGKNACKGEGWSKSESAKACTDAGGKVVAKK